MKNLLYVFVFSLVGCSVVGPGERGVRFHFGSASNEVAQPGAYVWIPFVSGMETLSVQIQGSKVESPAASKDMQEIVTHVVVNWSITPEDVVNIYRAVGNERAILDRIIVPAVNEVMKQAAALRTAEEALTKRLEMKEDIDRLLKTRLNAYGITLHDVSIVNFQYSQDFMHAIEQKQVAEQQAKQAEYVAVKAIQEAHAEVNRAKGQAESQQLRVRTLTKEILQQQAIDKWDGHFPSVMGSGTLPFINLDLKPRNSTTTPKE